MMKHFHNLPLWLMLCLPAILACSAFGQDAKTSDSDGYVVFDDATQWRLSGGEISAEQAHGGSRSIKVDDKGKPSLVPPAPISTSGYDRIEFWAHGGKEGTGCRRADVCLNGTTMTYGATQRIMQFPSGKWTKMSVPLIYLANPPVITEIFFIRDEAVGGGFPFYIDDIRLVRGKPQAPISPTYVAPEFPQMFKDGGFENGGIGQYTMGALCEVTTDPVYEGKYALRVFNRVQNKQKDGYAGWSGPNYEITPYFFQAGGPGIYEIEAYGYIKEGNGQLNMAIECISSDPLKAHAENCHIMEGGKRVDLEPGKWKQVKFHVQFNPGNFLSVLKINPTGSSSIGEYFIDNISMKKIKDLPKDDLTFHKPLAMPHDGETVEDIDSKYEIEILDSPAPQIGKLCYPHDLCLDPKGDLYIADTDNHRIVVCQKNGAWKEYKGSGELTFRYPRSVAVDSSGNVYVSDTGNHRLIKIDKAGQFSVIEIFHDSSQAYKLGGVSNMKKPFVCYGVDVDAKGNIYVVSTWIHKLWMLDTSGGWHDLMANPDPLLVKRTDSRREKVSEGVSAGRCCRPNSVFVSASGDLYFTDTGNNRIQKRSADGKWEIVCGKNPVMAHTHVSEVETMGSGFGEFAYPQKAVFVDGRLYVADTLNHRIQILGEDGKWLVLGKEGSGPGEFNAPAGIAVAEDGAIYVADTRNHRIQLLRKKR
jgi:DNA-binding beta-propeller fold protein YncE